MLRLIKYGVSFSIFPSNGSPLSPDLVNTSFAERQNPTMPMSMRRFTRLTNAARNSRTIACLALALYFMFYNFCRLHKTLGATLAMAVGLVDKVLKMSDVVSMITAAVRLPYKKRLLKFQTETLPDNGVSGLWT